MKYKKIDKAKRQPAYINNFTETITPQQLADEELESNFLIFIPEKRLFFWVDNADYDDDYAYFEFEMVVDKNIGLPTDMLTVPINKKINVIRL